MYGAFICARRALNSQKRRFSARAVAAMGGNLEMTQQLVALEVDVARENNSGVTAAALARQYGNTEVADAIAPR